MLMTHYCDVTNQNKILQQNNLQIVRVYVKTNEGGESSHQEGTELSILLKFFFWKKIPKLQESHPGSH